MCCVQVANGKPCRKATSVAPAPSTSIFWPGRPPVSLNNCGAPACWSMTNWKVLSGNGNPWMGPWSRRRWHWNLWGETPQIEEKKGSKRSLLTDEKGLPLALVISGANTHDVKLLAETLDAMVIERPGSERLKQNLCLDAGYVGEPARREIEDRGYVPHVRPRGEEIAEKDKNPDFKARRWVVEVCHSWFNRFRKLLVRYEKMDRSYLGLLMLAASVIVLRKIKRENQGNIIYG